VIDESSEFGARAARHLREEAAESFSERFSVPVHIRLNGVRGFLSSVRMPER